MQELWGAVLVQAVLNALGRSGYNRPDYKKGGKLYSPHAEALAWIEQDGPDFRAVCGLAGIDPDSVRRAVLAGRIGPLYLASPEIRPRRRTARPAPEGRAA